MQRVLPLAAALVCLAVGVSADPSLPRTSPEFEADIRHFEASTRLQPPTGNAVLFVGSSSVRLWKSLETDFPGLPVVNRGFGGSQLDDVLLYADRVVIPCRPRLVVVYAGENDLNAGKSPRHVRDDFARLTRRIHAALPETRIVFVSIKPSPSRWHLVDRVRRTNALIRQVVRQDARLEYADVFTPMLDAAGAPRDELFGGDLLHLNAQGYALWARVLEPILWETGQPLVAQVTSRNNP